MATALAAHAAIPVAVDPTLLNLIRSRFFIDPPDVLPYTVEAELLLSPLFRSIGPDLYQMDSDLRDLLLADLDVRYGAERAGEVAELLHQYSVETSPWTGLPRLDAAQRLTSYSFIDPDSAAQALKRADAFGSHSLADPQWRVAMREDFDRTSRATPSRSFDRALSAAKADRWKDFLVLFARGAERLPMHDSAGSARVLLDLGRRLTTAPKAYLGLVAEELVGVIDAVAGRSPVHGRQLRSLARDLLRAASAGQDASAQLQELGRLLEDVTSQSAPSPRARASWALRRMGVPLAWSEFGVDGSGVRVAVLATGTDGQHPDLVGKVWASYDFTGGPEDAAASVDPNGYGTSLASLVAGGDASGEAIGVSPGARLLSAVVLRADGSGREGDLLAALEWAEDQHADVVVIPLGSSRQERSPIFAEMIQVIDELGIIVVCAVGNEGHGHLLTPGNEPLAIGVGSTDREDEAASFSSGGVVPMDDDVYVKPDLVAPGVDIRTAQAGGGWRPMSGTGCSAGLLGGAVALLLSATSIRQQLSGRELTESVRQCLYSSAVELGQSGKDERYGWGLVDAYGAIREAWSLGFSM
ncbi:S8 family peptidase [Geodermatophilus dictyosporus]|uniref:S8 family peptidase n=1 Tax=Geodermatophilus dictyosporus TaxID=1523247 RepID=UPI0010AA02B3|nr:S8 family serine peptidase [Geodermatophilus dictyosporus]